MSIKTFRNNAYFVLYDLQDFPICYFDNIQELLKCINYEDRQLLYLFNKYGSLINIEINNIRYKICRFVD